MRHDVTSITEFEGEWHITCTCGRLFTAPYKSTALAQHEAHAEIRAWRDQTRGVYGQPYNELDPPLVWNNKGWWRDVCDLLDLLDGKPWREDNDGA